MEFGLDIDSSLEFDVVGFGLNAVDHLCVVPGFPECDSKTPMIEFRRAGGGQAASAMVLCARLGLRAKYVGKVGDDEVGAFSLKSIGSEGVDVSDVRVSRGATNQLAMIIVDASTGERTIMWHRPSAIVTSPDEVTAGKVAVGSVLHLDGHDAPAAARAARIARSRGIPVVLDAETVKERTDDLVRNTDILIASSGFPQLMTGIAEPVPALAAILEAGPRIAAMTRGANGAIAVTATEVLESPGFDVECVDTTGAGDIFHGAFIYGLVKGWQVERTLDFSNAAAALNCTALGARAGVRDLDQVLEFMGARGRI